MALQDDNKAIINRNSAEAVTFENVMKLLHTFKKTTEKAKHLS